MATRDDLAQLEARMDAKWDKRLDEIKRHFDTVAENIHADVAGANQDEISSIKDKQQEHDDRITTVERRVGLSP